MASVGIHVAVINNNEAVSGGFKLGEQDLVALEIPSTFNGTQITFQAKVTEGNSATSDGNTNNDPETWRNVYDSAGNELVVTVGSNRIVTDIPELGPLYYIRIRSGTSSSPVNQSPTCNIRVITKGR